MSNLKKILALALALAMVMSMTAFAGFTDAAKIDDNYAEAVEVLTGMGVIKGYTDGSFKPEGTITRAEVAAIIYRVATQDVKDSKAPLYAGLAKFSDVTAADWFAGYVGYCANAGYIKGYPDGTFKPQGLVTGFEALAMILRAMGYDAENEFTGITWQDKVAKAGTQAGILEELNGDEKLALAADRELVAQMAFTALNDATIVRYTPAFGYTNTATTLGDAFALAEAESYDAWGRPSYGYTYNTGNKKTLFPVEADATYITAVTECEIAEAIDFDGSVIYDVFYNSKTASYKYNVQALDTVQKVGAQGTLVEVYGEDRIVMIDTYLAKVTKVTECTYDVRGHLKAEAALTLSVYDKAEGSQVVLYSEDNWTYEAGDMLLVNAYTDVEGNVITGTGKYVEFVGYADALVGAQTLMWWNKEQHTIEGTTYDDAKWFELDQAGNETGKHTWWFDQYGNVIGATDIASVYTYGIIENIQWINPVGANGYAQATIRYMDETTETKIVTAIDGTTLFYAQESVVGNGAISTNFKNNAALCGTDLYRITTASSGSISLEHVFTAATEQVAKFDNELTKADIKTGIAAIAGVEGVCYTNSNTQYLIQVKGSSVTYKYVTGYENMANYTVNDNVTVDYVDLDGNGYADYVYVTGTPDSAKSSGLFYLTSDNVKVVLSSGAVSYYELTGILDGVPGTIKVKNAKDGNDELISLFNDVNRLYGVDFEDGKVVNVRNGNKAADVEYVINPYYTTNTAYDGLTLAAWYAGNGEASYDGFVLKIGEARYNVVGLTPVVGTWAEDMSDKEIYVIYDAANTIAGAYIAKDVYIAEKDDEAEDSTVTSDWVVEADGYAYNEKALKVAAPAGATMQDLATKYGGTVTAVYYTTASNGIVTKVEITNATNGGYTIDSLLAIGAKITLVNHKTWTVID